MAESSEARLKRLFSNVLVSMHGDYKDFQLALVRAIMERYGSSVHLLCKTAQDEKHYRRLGFTNVHRVAESPEGPAGKDVFKAARAIEAAHETKIHYHLIDRRCYFTGAPHFPSPSNRGYEAMVAEVCARFDSVISIVRDNNISLVLWSNRVLDDVAGAANVPRRNMHISLNGNYYIWFLDYARTERLIREKWEEAEKPEEGGLPELKQPDSYFAVRERILKSMTWPVVARNAAHALLREFYYRLRRYEKVTRFGFSGVRQAKYMVRQKMVFKGFMKRKLAGLADLEGLDYVYYPLAGEPEATLAFSSPEHMDQLSIIQSLSSSLPVGTYLAVKEHMIGIGVRPDDFYGTIEAMPNVLLVDPLVAGLEVSKRARAVATIGGASGMEAAMMGIPVLLFGINNYYHFLPHAHLVTSWVELHENIAQILDYGDEDRRRWLGAAKAFGRVLDEHAVNFDGLIDGAFKVVDQKAGAVLLDSLEASLAQGPGE